MHERSPRAREPGGADAAAAAREFRFIALCRESKRGVGKTMCVCVWGVKGIAAENGGDFGDFGDGGRSFPQHHPPDILVDARFSTIARVEMVSCGG